MDKKAIFAVSISLSVWLWPAAGEVLGEGGNMRLASPEFENNKFIPKKFTCEGEDVNPALIHEGPHIGPGRIDWAV